MTKRSKADYGAIARHLCDAGCESEDGIPGFLGRFEPGQHVEFPELIRRDFQKGETFEPQQDFLPTFHGVTKLTQCRRWEETSFMERVIQVLLIRS